MSPTTSKLNSNGIPLRRAVVTGATGCLGRAIVRELTERGTAVTVLVRSANHARALSGFAEVDLVEGDMSRLDGLRSALVEADAIFHAAAYVHSVARTEAERQTLYDVNVEGTRRLIDLLPQGVTRSFVLFSTIGVYGREHNGPLTEHTPVRPETEYGKSKLQAEDVMFSRLRGTSTRATALRFCMVYGEGDRGNMNRLIRSVRRGRYISVDGGRARKNLLYAHDAARAALLAAASDISDQQVFIVSDPVAYSMREIVEAVSKALHKKPPSLSLPGSLLRALGRGADVVRATGIKPPFTSADVRTLTRDVVCDPEKIRRMLGFHPGVTLEEGLERSIGWYTRPD